MTINILLRRIEDGCAWGISFAMKKQLSIDASGLFAIPAEWHVRKNRDTWESLIRILDSHRFPLNGRRAIDVFNRENTSFLVKRTSAADSDERPCNSRSHDKGKRESVCCANNSFNFASICTVANSLIGTQALYLPNIVSGCIWLVLRIDISIGKKYQ